MFNYHCQSSNFVVKYSGCIRANYKGNIFMNYFKKSVYIIFLTLFVFVLSFSSFAVFEGAPEKLYESRGGPMSVSYRGSGTDAAPIPDL